MALRAIRQTVLNDLAGKRVRAWFAVGPEYGGELRLRVELAEDPLERFAGLPVELPISTNTHKLVNLMRRREAEGLALSITRIERESDGVRIEEHPTASVGAAGTPGSEHRIPFAELAEPGTTRICWALRRARQDLEFMLFGYRMRRDDESNVRSSVRVAVLFDDHRSFAVDSGRPR